MRPDFLPTEQLIKTFIEDFERGRKAYAAQDWKVSMEAFSACAQIKPEDKASSLYIDRINHYLENPPESDWDGVYTFKGNLKQYTCTDH